MQYVIKQGQTIYDVALDTYKVAGYAVKLLEDNPQLVSLDNANIAGLSVYWDENLIVELPEPIRISAPTPENRDKIYIVKDGQSVYDLAIQLGYGLDGVGKLLVDYPHINSVDNTDLANTSLTVTNTQSKLSKYLNLRGINLNTGVLQPPGNYIVDNVGDLLGNDDFVLIYT